MLEGEASARSAYQCGSLTGVYPQAEGIGEKNGAAQPDHSFFEFSLYNSATIVYFLESPGGGFSVLCLDFLAIIS